LNKYSYENYSYGCFPLIYNMNRKISDNPFGTLRVQKLSSTWTACMQIYWTLDKRQAKPCTMHFTVYLCIALSFFNAQLITNTTPSTLDISWWQQIINPMAICVSQPARQPGMKATSHSKSRVDACLPGARAIMNHSQWLLSNPLARELTLGKLKIQGILTIKN
jgi:hypothetical protein